MDGEQLEKYRNAIINASVVILSLVIAYNIYKTHLVTALSLKAQISEEKKKNSELEKINLMERKISSYKRLLVKRDASAIMNDISEMAREADIKVISIKPSQGEAGADYLKDNFDVMVNAPHYNAVGKFVYLVESHNNLYMVDSLDINNKAETGPAGLTVNLRISSVVASSQ
ncbi:MAG: hypothetical protein WC478_02530 [Candidatus Omnitrophota bacterium]